MRHMKTSATRVLEVGIGSGAGSIRLWADYFVNAQVYTVDISKDESETQYGQPGHWDIIRNHERITMYVGCDAYSAAFASDKFSAMSGTFDMLLDDGPHTLASMKDFIRLYLHLMKEDGLFIVEDIKGWDWVKELSACVPGRWREHVHAYDLRRCKGRGDDIVFTICKNGRSATADEVIQSIIDKKEGRTANVASLPVWRNEATEREILQNTIMSEERKR